MTKEIKGKPGKRRYLLPEEGNLYKANLHCHSTVSDGKFSPEEIKALYKKQGYHAVAYTDHRACVPHTELTDDSFVALTGIEMAFGIGKNTSVHICGISRDPGFYCAKPDDPDDDIGRINGGIHWLKESNFITTLNHPRWSGMYPETVAAIGEVANMEVANGFEMIQDGYGDSSACYEVELRRGRKAFPLATDDSHTAVHRRPGYEYFRGFTCLKAESLTYDGLIRALDEGAFFASTGPEFQNLWLENGKLHIECSPVCGAYVHGHLYRHRAAVVAGEDRIETADIDIEKLFADSRYLFVQIVDAQGRRAWAPPLWFD